MPTREEIIRADASRLKPEPRKGPNAAPPAPLPAPVIEGMGVPRDAPVAPDDEIYQADGTPLMVPENSEPAEEATVVPMVHPAAAAAELGA